MVLVAAPWAVTRPGIATPAAIVYAGSSRICHQRPERSFHLAGVQLPVCARCVGLYASGALGALVAWRGARRPAARHRTLLLAAAAPTALTWTIEAAGLAGFSNTARALAALPLGAAAGWVFVEMLRYDFQLNGEVDHRGSRVRCC